MSESVAYLHKYVFDIQSQETLKEGEGAMEIIE